MAVKLCLIGFALHLSSSFSWTMAFCWIRWLLSECCIPSVATLAHNRRLFWR
jgi:hypothetical protein